MKSRILSIITALALCLSLCPTWAFAAEADPALCRHHSEHKEDCGYIAPPRATTAAMSIRTSATPWGRSPIQTAAIITRLAQMRRTCWTASTSMTASAAMSRPTPASPAGLSAVSAPSRP